MNVIDNVVVVVVVVVVVACCLLLVIDSAGSISTQAPRGLFFNRADPTVRP